MSEKLAMACSAVWSELGKNGGSTEAHRRAAINRLYYAAFTVCRVRLKFTLTNGRGQHRRIPEKMRNEGRRLGFSEEAEHIAHHFELLRELRGDSDYQFHHEINVDRQKKALELTRGILAAIAHPRWDGIERVENPSEDGAGGFLASLRELREAFKVAAHRYHDELTCSLRMQG